MPSPPASREDALAILEDIGTGTPNYKACRMHDVPKVAFYRAIGIDDDLQNRYALAKERQLDILAEEILELSDEHRPGERTKTGPKGKETTTGDMVERSKLQIEARKWLLAKLKPKKYGDRVTLAGDADSPLSVDIVDAKAALLGRLGADAASTAGSRVDGEPER